MYKNELVEGDGTIIFFLKIDLSSCHRIYFESFCSPKNLPCKDTLSSNLQETEAVGSNHFASGTQRGEHCQHDTFGEESSEMGCQNPGITIGFGRL